MAATLVNVFRTMRLKEPTVDLAYADGKLYASDSGVLVVVADGDANMEEGSVYEMDLVKNPNTGTITAVRPRLRVAKKVPNSMDVVKRAVASTAKDPSIDAALLDMTSMSFFMKERVYTITQAKAFRNKKVVATFGVGRFQEWKQLMTDNMSYIAIDSNIDISTVTDQEGEESHVPAL